MAKFLKTIQSTLKQKKPIKEEKTVGNTLPTASRTQLFIRLLWGFIILTFLLTFLFFINSFFLNIKTHKQHTQISSIEEKLNTITETQQSTDNLDVFSRFFIETYYSTAREAKVYAEALAPYFAKGIKLPDIQAIEADKTITSLQLWKKSTKDTVTNMEYLVSYSYVGRSDPANVGSGKEIICFEVMKDNGKYNVVSYPYTKRLETITAKGLEKAGNPYDKKEQVGSDDKEDVQKWLTETFFPRYYSSLKIDDVKYMMKKPTLLGGLQTFFEIKDLKVYPHKKDFIVKTTIKVIDNVSKMENLEEYTLKLSKEKDSKYYVEDITHTIGE